MAVDLAWEANRFDEVLLLLEKDSEFPNNFKIQSLSQSNEHEKRLIEFTEKRNQIHRLIQDSEDDVEQLKTLISNNKSKFYFNDKNESAVFTAIKNKKFRIYAFLQSTGAEFKDISEKKILDDLNKSERITIQNHLIHYFPRNPNAHILYLISKSRSSKPMSDFEGKVKNFYETLEKIPEISKIFQVIQYADYLDIVFDFENDDLSGISFSNARGETHYKRGRLYIAAGKERSEREILGTIAHEVTHMAMELMYENQCNPYYEYDETKKSQFENITINIHEKIILGKKDSLWNILFETFSNYHKSDHHSELIVRVPQILGQKEIGRQWLIEETNDLFNYFNELLTDFQNFIDKSFILKPKKQIRWMNESLGELKKIRESPLFFNDVSEIKSFLESTSKSIVLVVGANSWLCILKTFQGLYGKDYINYGDRYLALNFQKFVQNVHEIVQNFFAEGSDALIIELGKKDQEINVKNNRGKFEILSELLELKQNKKIVFAVHNDMESKIKNFLEQCSLDFDCFHDSRSSLCNLDIDSQNKILNKIICFQEKELSLIDLIRDDKIKSLIDAETIDELIGDQKIEIGSKIEGLASLDGAYANLQEEINTDILAREFLNSGSTIFVFEGCKKIEDLELIIREKSGSSNNESLHKKLVILKEENRLRIVKSYYHDEKFKDICQENPEKDIYWIQINNEKKSCLILRKLYTPNFYLERNFVMHLKIVIESEKLEELSKCKGIKLLISNTNRENFLAFLQNEQKNDGTNKVFISIIRTPSQVILETGQKANKKNFRENDTPEKKLDISRIIFAETQNEAQESFDELKKSYIIYWLKVEGDHVVYNDSSGSLNYLRSTIDVKQSKYCKISETDFIERMKHTKTIIIADDPGMGKSTTLTKLCKNESISDDHWIIKVNLKQFFEGMKIPDQNLDDIELKSNLVNYLSSELNTKSGKKLTKIFLKSAIYPEYDSPISLLLLFDAFDEVLDERKRNKITLLLKFLKEETKVKFVITTRLHCKNELEDSLSTFALEFQPMDSDIKREFIRKYLKIRLNLILEKEIFEKDLFSFYATKFLEKMGDIFKIDLARFIGTPLQLHLMLEDAVGNFRKWINQQNESNEDPNFSYFGNNMSEVYSNFINKKYDYFKGMKKEGTEYPLEDIKSICDTCHMELAETLTLEEKPKVSSVNFKNSSVALACGIVKCQNGELKFIHPTFREYYATKIFIDWLEKEERFSTNGNNGKLKYIFEIVLLIPDYSIIRSFLNDMFVEIKTRIASKNLKYLGKYLNEPLKKKRPAMLSYLNTIIREDHVNIFEFSIALIKEENLLNFKCRFGDSPLTYACRCNRKGIVECFLKKYDKTLNPAKFFKLLCMRGRSNETCLHHAAFYNNVDIIKLIIDKATEKCSSKQIYEFLDMKDAHNNTPLHLSASCLGQFFSAINEKLKQVHFLSLDLLPFIIVYQNHYKYLFPELPYEFMFKNTYQSSLKPDYDNKDRVILLILTQFIEDNFPDLNRNASNVFKLILDKIPENKVCGMIRAKNASGCNALYFAVANGDADLVQMILEKHQKTMPSHHSLLEHITETIDGNNIIHISIRIGQINMTRLILHQIPDDKIYEILCLTDDSDYNVLHLSAQDGQNDLIDFILRKLQKVISQQHFETFLFSKTTNDGLNPLHIAAVFDRLEVANVLLKYARKISIECQYNYLVLVQKNGWSSIDAAYDHDSFDTFQFLVNMIPLEKIYQTLSITNQEGYNFLHRSASWGKVNYVKVLLNKIKDIPVLDAKKFLHQKSNNGLNALILAVGQGHLPVVQLLLEYAAEISTECQYNYLISTNEGIGNAIQYANGRQNSDITRFLLEIVPAEKLYETLCVTDNKGNNILHVSSYLGNSTLVELILNKLFGISSSTENFGKFLLSKMERNFGFNSLHAAAEQGHSDVVQILLRFAANISPEFQCEYLTTVNEEKRNAIHIAALNDYQDIVEFLLNLISSPNMYHVLSLSDYRGFTVLHWPASKGNSHLVTFILNKLKKVASQKDIIAFLDLKTYYGFNALEVAKKLGHLNIVEILQGFAVRQGTSL